MRQGPPAAAAAAAAAAAGKTRQLKPQQRLLHPRLQCRVSPQHVLTHCRSSCIANKLLQTAVAPEPTPPKPALDTCASLPRSSCTERTSSSPAPAAQPAPLAPQHTGLAGARHSLSHVDFAFILRWPIPSKMVTGPTCDYLDMTVGGSHMSHGLKCHNVQLLTR
jgi:hypothetical protein